MRPRTLDEFIGQEGIVGPGRLLRRAIQADQLSSLIFYGPPGTGKTTLARIIANTTEANFVSLNAVLSGVKDIRESIADAKKARGQQGKRTILFVDEVHRFNKAQQDALLPWVENGTVTLIGATTENPYFEVNKALVSRSRIFQLTPLTEDGLKNVVHAAIADEQRGYGKKTVHLADDALEHLVNVANGDARALLNALELAVDTTVETDDGIIRVDLAVAEESIQQRAVLYDKEGDAHFDAISAFIKSCRGSDPDAALYWLARMVYAGEDPRYIFRRMLILASEDVGLADPDALVRISACASTFDRVGLPEGRFHLAQATLVLATAPKSNSTLGFFDALKAVKNEREGEVPNHLKDKARDAKSFGHGDGYLYPHSYQDHWVAQQYLPSSLQGQVFYQPSDSGFEARIRDDVSRRREAQLAASEAAHEAPLGLTFGPTDRAVERWIRRALEDSGRRLGAVRDRVHTLAAIERHHVVLDLNAGAGLLTWEAIRRAPEGGVYARVAPSDGRLADRARSLADLSKPIIIARDLVDLDDVFAEHEDIRFDRIIGHNPMLRITDKRLFAGLLAQRCTPTGRVVLAEIIPRHTQRLYLLCEPTDIDPELYKRWANAEEQIYADPADPILAWDAPDLTDAFESAGFEVEVEVTRTSADVRVTAQVIERWWSGTGDRASYGERLKDALTEEEVATLEAWCRRRWRDRTLSWGTTTAFVQARLVGSNVPQSALH